MSPHPDREVELLDRLARLCGILEGYYDIWGKYHPTGSSTQREILRAMGVQTGGAEELEEELRLREGEPWRRLAEPLFVFEQGQPQTLALAAPPGEWQVTGRCGTQPLGFRPLDADARGGDTELRLALDPPLPPGIHDVAVHLEGPAGEERVGTRVVVAPSRGFERPQGSRIWGVNIALYGLRSERNLGVGDFEDLRGAVEWAAGLGADMVGLLPLHALYNEPPYGIAPYYPSSRVFLNPLYVAVDQVPEAEDPTVQERRSAADTRERAAQLRNTELVAYGQVWALKRELLEACHQVLVSRGGERVQAFEAWRREQGPALEDYCTYCALRDHLARERGHPTRWQEWPEGFRSPDSPAVADFRREHPEAVGFHAYLQWLTEEQLRGVGQRARELGMAVGLYLDLALGVEPSGADAWVYQEVLALGASAGAPPDPFSLLGQRWGVCPPIPERHRLRGYDFFLDTLGRNAVRADAYRIDHVMALWRLFWIPGDLPAAEGAYVAERPEELLALLRLVSAREECLIVGEDLGTVPPEVREDLVASGFHTYRLLIFEKEWEGPFHPPQEYPRQALVSVTTHDLPSVDGFWTGRDLEVKRELHRYPDEEAARNDGEARRWDRLRLLQALETEGLLPAGLEPAHEVPEDRLDDLAEAVHAFLARTPSALMLVNLDDLVGEREMQNLPGTLDEHPNWRRKCRVPVDRLPSAARARRIAEAIRRVGRGR